MATDALRAAAGRLRRRQGTPLLEVRSSSSQLAWEAPATTISVAGVHGGAGASTLCLLVAHALAACAQAPALTVDLAGRSRGGLSVLGGAAGQASAEATAAVAAIHGGKLERPLGINEAGVRIIGAHPDGIEDIDHSQETLIARLRDAVARESDDARVAKLARTAVREQRSWHALRWDNEQSVNAITRVLDRAIDHHALVAVDLGMLDGEALARAVGARSDLHVWAVPGRASSLEIAQRRLPLVNLEPAGGEVIVVWQAEERAPSSKRLSALGDARGCRVVRMANHGGSRTDWPTRTLQCMSAITELCALTR